jgi:hypothetical protein
VLIAGNDVPSANAQVMPLSSRPQTAGGWTSHPPLPPPSPPEPPVELVLSPPVEALWLLLDVLAPEPVEAACGSSPGHPKSTSDDPIASHSKRIESRFMRRN